MWEIYIYYSYIQIAYNRGKAEQKKEYHFSNVIGGGYNEVLG